MLNVPVYCFLLFHVPFLPKVPFIVSYFTYMMCFFFMHNICMYMGFSCLFLNLTKVPFIASFLMNNVPSSFFCIPTAHKTFPFLFLSPWTYNFPTFLFVPVLLNKLHFPSFLLNIPCPSVKNCQFKCFFIFHLWNSVSRNHGFPRNKP